MREISIIIPIFNEGRNINELTQLITKNLARIKKRFKFEVIFVDDNSSDESHKILKNIRTKRIKYFIRKKIEICHNLVCWVLRKQNIIIY